MRVDGLAFWIGVAVMAAVIYLTRGLPFMLPARSRLLAFFSRQDSALAALGPSLLAGIAAAVITPDLIALPGGAALAAYLAGLAVTAIAARRLGNSGAAVLLGMAAYGVLRALF
jgi:branched-subunit amino acid transport protein